MFSGCECIESVMHFVTMSWAIVYWLLFPLAGVVKLVSRLFLMLYCSIINTEWRDNWNFKGNLAWLSQSLSFRMIHCRGLFLYLRENGKMSKIRVCHLFLNFWTWPRNTMSQLSLTSKMRATTAVMQASQSIPSWNPALHQTWWA